MSWNTARSRLRGTHRALSLGILLSTAALVVLHAGLLWQRLADHSIAQPAVMAKWALAAVIALGALVLRRVASSSRSTWLVFWAIVVLLHVVAPGAADTADLAVLTEAGLAAAAPLLVMFVAAVAVTSISITAFCAVQASAFSLAGLTSHARGRAPPQR
jgi:hypothetical protein